jgi:hypothetical protein
MPWRTISGRFDNVSKSCQTPSRRDPNCWLFATLAITKPGSLRHEIFLADVHFQA